MPNQIYEPPINCGEKAEPFSNRSAYYCDYCEQAPAEGVKLRWFTSGTLICDSDDCWTRAMSSWHHALRRLDEEDKEKAEHEKDVAGLDPY